MFVFVKLLNNSLNFSLNICVFVLHENAGVYFCFLFVCLFPEEFTHGKKKKLFLASIKTSDFFQKPEHSKIAGVPVVLVGLFNYSPKEERGKIN